MWPSFAHTQRIASGKPLRRDGSDRSLHASSFSREDDLERLAEAELLLNQTKARLERQREIVARLRRAGSDLTEALALLENMKQMHDRHEFRARYLQRWIRRDSE